MGGMDPKETSRPAGGEDGSRKRAEDRPLLPDRTSDEQDWDWRENSGNDDRLREDVPPHW